MISRLTRALVLIVLTAGLALLPTSAVLAEDAPDSTAPQVRLNPCFDATICRRIYAEVYGDLELGDDLAVLGARIGDHVLKEHVFDDGTGFQPMRAISRATPRSLSPRSSVPSRQDPSSG